MGSKKRKLHIDVTAKDKSKKAVAAVNKNLGSVGITAKSVGKLIGGAFSIVALERFASAVVKTTQEMERIQKRLDFAGQDFEYVREVSDKLGLSLLSTASDFSKFAAATKGTALEGEQARQVFESIAQASAVMGLSTEQTSGALKALEQMVSKGTVQAEELRGQLGERLPGAFNIAARAMGVTTQELGKMLEQGQVLASDLLPKLAVELKKTYQGEAPKLTRAINAIDTSFDSLMITLGATGAQDGVISAMNGTADAVDGISLAIKGLDNALGSTDIDNKLLSILQNSSPVAQLFKLLGVAGQGGFSDLAGALGRGATLGTITPRPTVLPTTTVTGDAPLGDDLSFGQSLGGWEAQEAHRQEELQRLQDQNADKFALEIEAGQQMQDLWMTQADDRLAVHGRVIDAEIEAEKFLTAYKKQSQASAVNNAVNLLNLLGQKNRAAAIAAIVVQKGLAIGQTFISGKAAEIRALADLGPVAGSAMAAKIEFMTNLNMGLIAATGIAQISQGGSSSGGGTFSSPVVTQPAGQQTQQAQQSITVVIEGNVIGEQDHVDNVIIPAINDAISRKITLDGGQ